MEPGVVCLKEQWITIFEENLETNGPQKKIWKDEQKKESKYLLHKKQYKFYPDSVWAQAKKYKMFYAYDHCNCSTNKRE